MQLRELGDVMAAPWFALGAAYFWGRSGLVEFALLMFMLVGAMIDTWFTWSLNKSLGWAVGLASLIGFLLFIQ